VDVETASSMSPPEPQTMLILCGLIGSGKSTFAEALQHHIPRFVRCNQDDLGGQRKRVEALVHQSLGAGKSVIVDRTNIDSAQRRTWVNIARQYPGTIIWMLVIDTPYDVCKKRLEIRTDHPTITTVELAYTVLERFLTDYQKPSANEGFDRIFNLLPHPDPNFSLEDVQAVLDSIEASPVIPRPPQGATPSNSGQGGGWRGGNERGRGSGGRGRGGGWNSSGRGTGSSSNTSPRGGGRGWGNRGGSLQASQTNPAPNLWQASPWARAPTAPSAAAAPATSSTEQSAEQSTEQSTEQS